MQHNPSSNHTQPPHIDLNCITPTDFVRLSIWWMHRAISNTDSMLNNTTLINQKVDKLINELIQKIELMLSNEIKKIVQAIETKISEVNQEINSMNSKYIEIDKVSEKADKISEEADKISKKADEISEKADEISGKLDEIIWKVSLMDYYSIMKKMDLISRHENTAGTIPLSTDQTLPGRSVPTHQRTPNVTQPAMKMKHPFPAQDYNSDLITLSKEGQGGPSTNLTITSGTITKKNTNMIYHPHHNSHHNYNDGEAYHLSHFSHNI